MKGVNDYSKYNYTVNNVENFGLSEALRLWKTKSQGDFKDFEKLVIQHESLHDFRDFVAEVWDDIQPVTVNEALRVDNLEKRRTYFDAIGTTRLFKELDPKLLDRQMVRKKRARWDEQNKEYEHVFEDVYELYEIEGKKLFGNMPVTMNSLRALPIFAVRCWCTTTNREYWIYVSPEAATQKRWLNEDRTEETYDAIHAIAWTIRLDMSMPEKIYRQGDIIVAKLSQESQKVPFYHLTKNQYLNLMYSET